MVFMEEVILMFVYSKSLERLVVCVSKCALLFIYIYIFPFHTIVHKLPELCWLIFPFQHSSSNCGGICSQASLVQYCENPFIGYLMNRLLTWCKCPAVWWPAGAPPGAVHSPADWPPTPLPAEDTTSGSLSAADQSMHTQNTTFNLYSFY